MRETKEAGASAPAAVVAAARDPANPLHPCFTWEDTEAAGRWREHEARAIIHSIRVVVAGDDGPAERVAFVSVRVQEGGRDYLPSSVVLSDADYRRQALADALAAMEGFRRRFAHLDELAGVLEAIERAREALGPAAAVA